MDLKDGLLPDLANTPKAVRKRRAPKHDFKDGAGRVFAHKHDNGGGWVADTARVAESVRVTRNAQVAQFARIEDNCSIEGRAVVSGHARLAGHVRVAQDARVDGNARVLDRAQVLNTARVTENAFVGGNSALQNRTLVAGWAHLVNTRVCGPTAHYEALVMGNARLLDSNLWGLAMISDSAIIYRSTVNNARVLLSARLLDSNLATSLAAPVWAALTRGAVLDDRPMIEHLAQFCGTFVRSALTFPVCTLHETTQFFDCRLTLATFPLPELRNQLYCSINTNDPAAVIGYAARSGGAAAAAVNIPPQLASGAPVVASVGVVHHPETIRQRRIMRLERSEE